MHRVSTADADGARRLAATTEIERLTLALTPIWGLTVCMIAHIVVARAFRNLARVAGIVLSLTAGLCVILTGVLMFSLGAAADTAAGELVATASLWLTAYLALGYAYVFGIFNLMDSARRVRLLSDLCEAGQRGLSLEEILRVYNAEVIVDLRLNRMLRGGQIAERDGRYFIDHPLMIWIAKMFVFLKLAFFGAPSEFGEIGPAVAHRRHRPDIRGRQAPRDQGSDGPV